jgi:hypothetical protein
MPRDGSGNYALPAGNPVVTATTISSSWANTTLSDIAQALTDSVSAGKVGANGLVARTSGSTWAARTITGTANKLDVTNGDGVAGNPTLTVPVRGSWHNSAWGIQGTGVGAAAAASLTLQDETLASLGAFVKLNDASNTVYLISFNGDIALAPNNSVTLTAIPTALVPNGANVIDLGTAANYFRTLFSSTIELTAAQPYIDFKDNTGEDFDVRLIRTGADTFDIQGLGSLGLLKDGYHVFHAQNVLGAITMSGGLPTNGIMEAGLNANGIYYRFASGLQICTHIRAETDINSAVGALYFSPLTSGWTYPAAFTNQPYATAKPYDIGFAWGTTVPTTNTTQAGFLYASPVSVAGAFSAELFAVGYWL